MVLTYSKAVWLYNGGDESKHGLTIGYIEQGASEDKLLRFFKDAKDCIVVLDEMDMLAGQEVKVASALLSVIDRDQTFLYIIGMSACE